MAVHNLLGKEGEDIAVDFLIRKGYKIIERNKRYGHLEIDIIAEHEDMIVFIEVKSRSGTYFEQPFQAVTLKKQRNIIKAANIYIEENSVDNEARFDIISIVKKDGCFFTEHIEDAFYPML
ncbi:MAG: YraN family protein [Chlorobi bacterium]|nr:YraN family protein [Chlorobiota bacterium]